MPNNSTQLSANQFTMLVIDDETAIQKILTHFFKEKYQVITCNNGREALEWLYSGNLPDFIVADINMPVLDGLEFMNEIKESGLFYSIPLIFLSGVDNSETKIKCLEAGADDFIIKPFNPKELDARIKAIQRRINLNNLV